MNNIIMTMPHIERYRNIMSDALNELVTILDLEQLDTGLFRGTSLDIGTSRIYGGQVLGQALRAMQATVHDFKIVHSMHAYFLREGDHNLPIDYQVDTSRDGKSFSTRHVTALQRNKPIYIGSASFQINEDGLEYQQLIPEVSAPESLKTLSDDNTGDLGKSQSSMHTLQKLSAPFDIRSVPYSITEDSFQQLTWIKTIRPVEHNEYLHRSILAYISDYGLITSVLLPHGLKLENQQLKIASIDHVIWFHRRFCVDEWLLYICEPITTNGARGLAKGNFYREDGVLVATTIQEGLLRP